MQDITGHENHSHDMVLDEVMCHFPYAVFSVAFSLIAAALLGYFSFGASTKAVEHGSHVLFHSFHFLHLVFAATGAVLTFFRFSKNIWKGLLVGGISAIFFCIMSDVVVPYWIGTVLGVKMTFHICFTHELHNVLPFLLVGLLNGLILGYHPTAVQSFYALWSHFTHIFVSSMASVLYIISHGFHNWYSSMGIVFVLLIIAVVIPCTLSDVVVPMYFARKKNCKH
jgi:hypothetical protein